jgi:hypothetical protein
VSSGIPLRVQRLIRNPIDLTADDLKEVPEYDG